MKTSDRQRRRLRVVTASLAAAIAAGYGAAPASAATKTWDLDSAGHNNGVINNGGGIWSKLSADPNWTTDGGATNTTFNDGDDAIFGGNPGVGAAGTITLSGSRTVLSMTFNAPASGSFSITASGADLLSFIAPNTSITQNSNAAVSITAPIEGN